MAHRSARRGRTTTSDEDEDRLEELIARHQQRNVAHWGDEGARQGGIGQRGEQQGQKIPRDKPRKKMQNQERGRYADLARELDAERVGNGGEEYGNDDFDSSFHFDTEGDASRAAAEKVVDNKSHMEQAKTQTGLLLPSNVLVEENKSATEANGNKEAPMPPVDAAESDERNIGDDDEGQMGDFVTLDAGRDSQSARYYEVEEYEQRKALEECPTCGEKGHDKKSCPHLQCLACGALDDHATRDCRQGVSCFRCGKLGHKSQECHASRRQAMPGRGSRDCMRCGSTRHNNASCHLLWRVYNFNDASTFETIRKAKWREYGQIADEHANGGPSRLGTHDIGDFQYRSEDESDVEDGQVASTSHRPDSPPRDWDPAERFCYNCAAQGDHWGDDCPVPRCNPIRPSGDYSAYSELAAEGGPLALRYSSRFRRQTAYSNNRYPSSSLDYIDNFQAGPHASIHVFDPPYARSSAERRHGLPPSAPVRQHEFRSKREQRHDEAQRRMPSALEARISDPRRHLERDRREEGKRSQWERENEHTRHRSGRLDDYNSHRPRDDHVPRQKHHKPEKRKNARAPSPTPSTDGGNHHRKRRRRPARSKSAKASKTASS